MSREERKDWKCTENTNQSGRDGRHRSRLRDDEPSPCVKKSAKRPVRIANINIFAARLRLHRAEFRVSKRAEEREQSAHQPSQIHQLGRAHRLHHLSGNQKDSTPDNGSHNHAQAWLTPRSRASSGRVVSLNSGIGRGAGSVILAKLAAYPASLRFKILSH